MVLSVEIPCDPSVTQVGRRYIARDDYWPGVTGWGDTPEEAVERLKSQVELKAQTAIAQVRREAAYRVPA